tara:strand:+ start:143 stop:871 length:729 start_codon:yes stop_codon:yes gene_type:complete
MAYTPPNTFTTGQVLSADDIKANDDALKVYLHEGIVTADLKASAPWVQPRHIQAPVLDPIAGVQHGVTGIQGSQWDGGALVRCQFGTALLTGQRFATVEPTDPEAWVAIPQTSFTISLRKTTPAPTVIFHWWMESNNGPDNGKRSTGALSYMWVAENIRHPSAAGNVVPGYAQEAINNHLNFTSAGNPPAGPYLPYTLLGYGNMSGTKVFTTNQDIAIGLAHWSTIDRSAIINWGISLEVYY